MDDQALPNTLYDGTVGINLVFHLYEWIYHDRKYHKICEVLDNRLLRYIDTISEGNRISKTLIQESLAAKVRFYIRWVFYMKYMMISSIRNISISG